MLMEWILSAYDVADEIKATELFQSLISIQRSIQLNESLKMSFFQEAKTNFESIQLTRDQYDPTYKEAAIKLSEAKKNLYESPLVQQYFETQHQVESMLHQLLNEIAEAISPYIKTPTSSKKIGGSCGIN